MRAGKIRYAGVSNFLGWQSKKMFTALAKAMVPTLEQMPAADPEVTLPLCDPLTDAAEGALGKVTVRRDNPDTDTKGARTAAGPTARSARPRRTATRR